MIGRVRQFVSAVTAKITLADKNFAKDYLDKEEIVFFGQLSKADQLHSIKVAKAIKELCKEMAGIDEQLAIRVAFLHDIGRYGDLMGTVSKVICVLVDKIFSKQAKLLAKKERQTSWLGKRLYIYYEHPFLGGSLLRKLGKEKEAHIIEMHHKTPTGDEPLELKALRIADEKN